MCPLSRINFNPPGRTRAGASSRRLLPLSALDVQRVGRDAGQRRLRTITVHNAVRGRGGRSRLTDFCSTVAPKVGTMSSERREEYVGVEAEMYYQRKNSSEVENTHVLIR